jgi:hypothetical protein
VLLFAVSKSLENLIRLTGKSVSFETILKASMAWKAGQLVLPRAFSDLSRREKNLVAASLK